MSFNCLILNPNSTLNTNCLIPIFITKEDNKEFVNVGQRKISSNISTVVLLKNEIRIEIRIVTKISLSNMKLWKVVNVKMNDIKIKIFLPNMMLKINLTGKKSILLSYL